MKRQPCRHARAGLVYNETYTKTRDVKDHKAAVTVCSRPACIAWAKEKVARITGETAVYSPDPQPLQKVPEEVSVEEALEVEKPFKVEIAWGSENESKYSENAEDDSIDWCEYSFETEAELHAFLLGVDESSGWMDYAQKETP